MPPQANERRRSRENSDADREDERSKRRRELLFVQEEQTAEERLEIRKDQRHLKDDLLTGAYENLDDVREKNNKCFQKVRKTRELLLDTSNVEEISKKYAQQAEQSVQVPRYDANRIIQTLLRTCHDGNGAVDWKTFGQQAVICFNAVPSRCSFAAGRWDDPSLVQRKPRAAPQKRVANHAPEQRPQDVETKPDGPRKTLSVAEKSVAALKRDLKEDFQNVVAKDPAKAHLNGIEFLFDGQSFTKTVENMFYFSFLVKRSEASVKVTGSDLGGGRYELKPTMGEESPAARQGMITLTMRDYRRLVKAAEASDA